MLMPVSAANGRTRLFKWRYFEPEIMLLCARWYLRHALSYRDLQ